MSNLWVISDHHLGHAATFLHFKKWDGSPLRSFGSTEEMDDYLITKNNEVVKPNDLVYWLGDVTMDKRHLDKIKSFHGKKRLVQGNHDSFDIKSYAQYFEKIFSTRLLDKVLMSHIPVSPLSIKPGNINAHGHSHGSHPDHFGKQYYNCSCEMLTDYTPIAFEDLKKKAFARLET